MNEKKFPLGIFALGILVGFFIVGGVLFAYACLIFSNLTNENLYSSGILGGVGDRVRNGVLETERKKNLSSAFGPVVGVENGTVTITTRGEGGEPVSRTFRYDENTKFVTLEHDDASTETPIIPENLSTGEEVIVKCENPIEGNDLPLATKVTRL